MSFSDIFHSTAPLGDANDPEEGSPDWSKNSLAVVCSSKGSAWVMFYVGAYLDTEIDNVGRDAEDVGICPDMDGIWIWEGKFVGGGSYNGYSGDYEEWQPCGTHRLPTDEEWEVIKMGICPWDEDEWLVKGES